MVLSHSAERSRLIKNRFPGFLGPQLTNTPQYRPCSVKIILWLKQESSGAMYSNVHCTMSNGHMGPPPCGETDITKNITFLQLHWREVTKRRDKRKIKSSNFTNVYREDLIKELFNLLHKFCTLLKTVVTYVGITELLSCDNYRA